MQPLPDQSHIDRVREALWSRSGGASVMVGSGFSKCAQKARPDANDPPSWRELATQMFERLYPKDTEGSLLSESTEKEVIENPLRMAQEYEAAFRANRSAPVPSTVNPG